jgi:hypothetical protein
MLGIKSISEDYYGAEPEYDNSLICDKCCADIAAGDSYAEKCSGEIYCADCIEKCDLDDIIDFFGYNDIFDLLKKLKELKIAESSA